MKLALVSLVLSLILLVGCSPTPLPDYRTTLTPQEGCLQDQGQWITFENSCADLCIQDACQETITQSCQCGENRCFDGLNCVQNT